MVATINRYELDTAVNGAFMRIELNRAFGNPRDIVADPELSNLLTTRVPTSVRNAIVEAFYAIFIAPFIEREDWRGAVDAYAASVHPSIGDLLRTREASRDVKVQRCLACLAVTKHDFNTAKRLQDESKDAAVQALCGIVPRVDIVRSAPMELFRAAWEVQDWMAVHQLGVAVLRDPEETASARELVAQVLRKSLEVAPNADLRKFVSEETQREAKPSLVQSWEEVGTALKQGEFDKVLAFLNVEDRLRLDLSRASEIDSLFALIGDLLTMPGLDQVKGVDLRDIIGSALIEDCIQDPGFPNAGLKSLYGMLFGFWVSQRRKSGALSSETTFLLLAAGLLELDVDFSGVIFSAVLDWWSSRRNSNRVGFLIRSLELLYGCGIPESQARDLWETAAQDVLRFWSELSTTDRNAWFSLGAQLQVSSEWLTTLKQTKSTERADPLASIKLSKVAIVSLNESAATQAAAQIRQRVNCEVVLVTDKTGGTATASALSADVILFVWRVTKHAVYRAFDKVRNRLQYVTGTGATSIVSSLEQWATQKVGD